MTSYYYITTVLFSRLAHEVLLNGQYGKENDVFMLGTVMWQVFNISELAARDPLASFRDFAPCAKIKKHQVHVFPFDLDRYLVLSSQ